MIYFVLNFFLLLFSLSPLFLLLLLERVTLEKDPRECRKGRKSTKHVPKNSLAICIYPIALFTFKLIQVENV